MSADNNNNSDPAIQAIKIEIIATEGKLVNAGEYLDEGLSKYKRFYASIFDSVNTAEAEKKLPAEKRPKRCEDCAAKIELVSDEVKAAEADMRTLDQVYKDHVTPLLQRIDERMKRASDSVKDMPCRNKAKRRDALLEQLLGGGQI